jgi:hypothetical protein
MAATIIPTSIEDSNYRQIVSLSGVDYELFFAWNSRESRWYFSLSNDGVRLLSGIKVVINWPLIRPGQSLPMSPGMLIAIDATGAGVDPGLSDFGDRVTLMYVDNS